MMLLAAALAAASVSGAARAAQPQPSPAPAAAEPETADVAAIRAFIAAMEDDTEESVELLAAARQAEARLEPWPSSLPDRATVRAIIAVVDAVGGVLTAFRANNALQVHTLPVLQQITEAADRIDRRQAPRTWAAVQVLAVEVLGRLYPLIRFGVPEAELPELVAGFRERADPLVADESGITPMQRATVLASLARVYAPAPGPARPGEDNGASIDFYRRAWRLTLSASAPDAAREFLVEAAGVTLRTDPSGSQAEALLFAEAQSGSTDWLSRRTVYQLRMRIADSRGDHDAHDAVSDLWMSALRDDLMAAGAPFWAAAVPLDAQISYLAGPLRRGDPAAALARFDRLAEAIRIDGAANIPGLPETSPGAAGAAPALAPTRPEALGVDLILVAVGRDAGTLSPSQGQGLLQRTTAGDAAAMAASSTIDWGALAAGAGGPRAATTQSGVDPRLILIETGRGLASMIPALLQAFGAPPMPPGQLEASRDAMAAQIPTFETQFFAAFGKPIDDLAGGRCASGRPLSGAPPRILLILSASLSFFPVEMARAPNGRRLIDCYEFRRAPTLAAARSAAARWPGRIRLQGIAGVWNPQGDLADAEAELPLIAAAAGGRAAIVPLDPASAATILRPAGGAAIVHIAGHGRLGLLDPFESSVAVAPDRLLSFREIGQMHEPATALLVVLSACEAGLSTPQSGEVAYWGMASAFLSAGAGGVVGALWQVRDDAAALAIGKFYELMLKRDRPPAAALREAQLWLRDASLAELMRFVEASEPYADATGRERLAGLQAAIAAAAAAAPGAAPYADPLLWGGFGYFGTYPAR